MSNVKVSIIIPVYNPRELLVKCLDSVINQTLRDIEIICIDDGSSDGSIDILNEFYQKDNRIKIFRQKNKGAGFSRNLGLEHANGDYIVFLDSDDWIEKDMCETLYKKAINSNCDLILFNAFRHLENNTTKDLIHFPNNINENSETFTFDYTYIKNKVFNGYFGVIWCKFYKKTFLKENNIIFENHKMFQDVEFHIKTLLLAKKIAYCHNVFYHYIRIGQNSIQESYSTTEELMCFYDVMCGVREFLLNNNFMNEFRMEYFDYSCYYFKTKLNNIEQDYKEEFFTKIKEFFKTMKATPKELEKLHNEHVTFYIHILNSENYEEYNKIHNEFNGQNLNSNVSQNYIDIENHEIYNKIYINLLENDLNKKSNSLKSLKDELNDKNREINETNNLLNELTEDCENLKSIQGKLTEENERLKKEKMKLINENKNLKDEINGIKSSKLWKLQNKF